MTAPVITGIGVLAPTGADAAQHWETVREGRSGLVELDRFTPNPYPVKVAGLIPDFDPRGQVPGRLIPQTDVWTQHGLTQAVLAFADAGLEPSSVPEYEIGVVTANSAGGTEYGQREIGKLWRDGPSFVSPYQSIAWFYAATTGQVSIRHGLRGTCDAIVSEGAGGLDAFGCAIRSMADGTKVMLCGGTDSAMSPYGLVCQLSNGRLSRDPCPDTAYRPFAENAAGYVPGEGGAMFVLERRAEARQRAAAQVYGSVLGTASTFDPRPGSGRPPALRRAIELALARSGLRPDEIDVVYADAAGLPELDAQEAATLVEVFGPKGVPVTAPKAATGRLHSGGAALDVATALLGLRDGIIPPTVNVDRVDPAYGLDLVVGTAREVPLGNSLVLARGYGGFNAALVLAA